jgi:3-deoxy-manno-octulosonate cytidylyltransferase (CMP-KDO synthetase)
MKAIGVIPARWGSTRFEGKVLAQIMGKPMIQHVWERSRQSRVLDEIIVACDDERIFKAVERFGGRAVMTSKAHASGTDRIVEAVDPIQADVIVNIQGDEPLIHYTIIDDLAEALLRDKNISMATVIKSVVSQEELMNPNVVKVVVDGRFFALYFSRSVIPYAREAAGVLKTVYYKHLGIYAYRRDFLLSFKDMPKSMLETAEQLEQLRALEAGFKIKTIVTDMETIGVDTPADLACVERLLS